MKAIKDIPLRESEMTEAFEELNGGVHVALETYSNVHRDSGHNSMVSTHLFAGAGVKQQ